MKIKSTLGLYLTALAVMLMTTAAFAAPDEKLEIGSEAPNFDLPTVGSGENVELADLKGKTVVLHFQSMECPWDKGYQPMLNEVAKEHGNGGEVVFLAINSNGNEPVDKLEGYAEDKMAYPLLKDEGNKVADMYHAQTTPHIFIIDAQGQLAYQGGIEKAPSGVKQIGESDEQYLVPALEAMASGSEIAHTDTKSKGCTIKRVKG